MRNGNEKPENVTLRELVPAVVAMVSATGYSMGIGGKTSTTIPVMTAATAHNRFSPSIPAGVEFSISTNGYWVRADYFLCRRGRTWILEDQDTQEERSFRTEAAGLAALAALV